LANMSAVFHEIANRTDSVGLIYLLRCGSRRRWPPTQGSC
jgi:hypothetical protein